MPGDRGEVPEEEVRRIARLARLRLDGEEARRLALELGSILEHVEALGELDLTDVEGTGGVAEGAAPEREEAGAPDPLHSPPGEMAPGWVDGFFSVPRLEALDREGAAGEPEGGRGAGEGPAAPPPPEGEGQ